MRSFLGKLFEFQLAFNHFMVGICATHLTSTSVPLQRFLVNQFTTELVFGPHRTSLATVSRSWAQTRAKSLVGRALNSGCKRGRNRTSQPNDLAYNGPRPQNVRASVEFHRYRDLPTRDDKVQRTGSTGCDIPFDIALSKNRRR